MSLKDKKVGTRYYGNDVDLAVKELKEWIITWTDIDLKHRVRLRDFIDEVFG